MLPWTMDSLLDYGLSWPYLCVWPSSGTFFQAFPGLCPLWYEVFLGVLPQINTRSLTNKTFILNNFFSSHFLYFFCWWKPGLRQLTTTASTRLFCLHLPMGVCLLADFHIYCPVDHFSTDFKSHLVSSDLTQFVEGPTHHLGHTLDVTIVSRLSVSFRKEGQSRLFCCSCTVCCVWELWACFFLISSSSASFSFGIPQGSILIIFSLYMLHLLSIIAGTIYLSIAM